MSDSITQGIYPQTPGAFDATFLPDQLIAGVFQPVTGNVTLAGGNGVLKRGTVLGAITAGGKHVPASSSASDGSQNPVAILADTYDTTSGDVVGAGVYLTGEFNINAVTLGAGLTPEAATAALRPLSIFLKSAVSAADPS
ncbi:head decoration protein [Asaia astilbis]|uniref:head decoration protein n=1 Tax=Asaia astilbis TaxID=610244 RepID=UPI000471DCA3|nr:head decoration protein [Asaia astilbis]